MFCLKQYDTPLVWFAITDDPIDGQQCRITRIDQEQISRMPLGLRLDDAGLMEWLRRRIIPKNRE